VIDIHTHLLPGVDDGSPSIQASLPVLDRFGRDGVNVVVCTPHLLATDAFRAPVEKYASILARLSARAPTRPELLQGWEIMLDAPGMDLRAPDLHLGGSEAALVEFPRMNVPPGASHELLRIRMSGVIPVLAHPERYYGATIEQVYEWRDVGAVIQLDAIMLFGTSSGCRLARQMLEEGLVDCIASDNHGDARSLASARDWLIELGAAEQARLLTHTNAQRLLAGEPLIPVAPVPHAEPGMLGKLRQMLFGRK
jgi:protein-tyrosine phosphatase